jgi:RecA-family ATPase
MVDTAIRTIKPDLCIIDGVKDLMTDINDAVQATLIMEKLMALAQELNCCIVCVLHQNKSEQDRNMRGSIGTELTNKAFEVFQCETIDESETFKVTHTFSRKRRMKRKFYYRVNEQGLPEELTNYQEQPRDTHGRFMSKQSLEDVAPEIDLRKLFTTALEGHTQRPFNEVMAIALKKCGIIDAKAYYYYLDQAIAQGIIRKEVQDETGRTWIMLVDNQLPF